MTEAMGRFAFKALDRRGVVRKGDIHALDPSEVRRRLTAEDLRVIVIRQTGTRTGSKPDLIRGSRISERHIARFFDDLALLMSAGMNVDGALQQMAAHGSDAAMRPKIARMDRELQSGSTFAQAVETAGGFPESILALLESGQATGRLVQVVGDLADDYAKRVKARARFLAALAYPAFLVLMLCATIVMLTLFLVPALAPVFETAGQTPPMLVTILTRTGDWLAAWAVQLVLVLGLIALACAVTRSRTLVLNAVRAAARRLPFVRRIRHTMAVSRYLGALALLLRNGVKAASAMELAARTTSATELRPALLDCRFRVVDGMRLSESLAESDIFDTATLSLIAMGDEVNRLPDVLQRSADLPRDRAERDVDRLVALMTPTITLVLGGLIGALVISVMTTLLSLGEMAAI